MGQIDEIEPLVCGKNLSNPSRRLAFVTLGQSPRIDLVPELLAELKTPVEALEYGLLDDIEADRLGEAAAVGDEASFLTRLRDGSYFELSVAWAHIRFIEVYENIKTQGADLVILMSASCGHDFKADSATVVCDNVVSRAIEVMASAELRVGVVVPLEALLEKIEIVGGPWACKKMQAAKPGDFTELGPALSKMADCDIIALHSMGYDEADLMEARRLTGKPVIMNRRLIANAVKSALAQLDESKGIYGEPALLNRLRSLSNRQRETMYYVAEGLSNKAIARHLDISFRTVEIHRARMMEKMAFRSISDLVRVVDLVSDF
jgi:protein AroM